MTWLPYNSRLGRGLAIGTGVGIEMGMRDLRVVAARVRPGGVRVLGSTVIELSLIHI